jgi:hypothetical protein
MVWLNNETNWLSTESFGSDVMNRIEGNIDGLNNTYNIGGTATFRIGTNGSASNALELTVPDELILWEDAVYAPYPNSKIALYQAYSDIDHDMARVSQGTTRLQDKIPNYHKIDMLLANSDGTETLISSYSLAGISAQTWTFDTAPVICSNIPEDSHVIVRYIFQTQLAFPSVFPWMVCGMINCNFLLKVLP